MISNTGKNLILTVFSTLFGLVLFIGAYELVKSQRYDAWKAEYEKSGDWYGKLTIPSPNPVLMWEYRPNFQAMKWGSVISTNEHGFRDRERSVAKKDGWRRVAIVGDSVTLGIGVDGEKTFSRRIEDLIQERRRTAKVEIFGFAVDSYNTMQVMEMVRQRVLPFRPDRVVYVMCMNDFDFEGASAGKIKYFRKPDSFFMLRIEKLYKQFFEYHDYYYRKNAGAVIEHILQTRDVLAEQGATLDVVLLPIFPDQGFSAYPIGHMHKELATTLGQNGIGVIDLLESPLTRGASPRTYALDIWHLNEHGHELLASLLFKALF
jgi:lysophospholipase L1-like esterase